MREYSTVSIPTILNPPIKLADIIYNCPVCDFEIDIDMIVDENTFVECENCNHLIKFEIKKV